MRGRGRKRERERGKKRGGESEGRYTCTKRNRGGREGRKTTSVPILKNN